MSDRRPGSNKPSWKNSSGGNFSRKQGGPGWKKEKTVKEKGVRSGGRTARLIQFSVAFTACVGLIIALIYLLFPPRPAHLVLVGDDYAETLAVPQNVRGMNLLRSIRTLGGKETGLALWGSRKLNVAEIVDLGDDSGWSGKWKTLVSDLYKPSRDKAVVVCLTLHGAVDPKAGPYLLAGAGNADANRLPVAEVIDALSKFPSDKDVILVLDAAGIDADWPLGIVGNEFGRKLLDLKPKIESVPNLWVIASCGADERSWASRTSRLSIFGEAFFDALAGKAAGDTGRVTLGRLFDHVKSEVSKRAGAQWGATQTPVLISGKPAEAAARIQINIVAKSEGEAAAPPVSPPADASRWADFAALARQTPSPATFAPREWRELREAVVRSEQLAALGRPARPERLESAIADLLKKIEDLRFVALKNSERNGLATAALAGRSLAPPVSPTPTDFAAFWIKAPSDTLSKDWDKLVGSGDGPSLKTRFFDQAIGSLSQTEGEELKSLARIRALVDALRPSPVPNEVHFATMLERHASAAGRAAPEFRSLAARALALRRRAERAAVGCDETESSHAERIAPRVRATVDAADVDRRRGEDLLFSSEPQDWREAARLLGRAETAYASAERLAKDLRRIVSVRERALADLPFFGRWAAERISIVESRDADVALATLAETLWEKVHRLRAPLDGEPAAIAAVVKTADEVEAGLKRLDDRHAEDLGALDGNAASLAPDWDLTAALAVPIPRKGERSSFVQPIRTRAAGKGVDAALRNRKIRLQARLAMAELGRPWFDRNALPPADGKSAEGGLEQFDAVRKRLDGALPDGPESDAAKRGEAVTFVGDQIGRRYRDLARECDVLADGRAKVDVKQGSAEVRLAEDVERIMPGFARPKRSPTVENRRAAVHDELVAQARRSWTDHWFAEDPQLEPYYVTGGLAYLKDAGAWLAASPDADAAKRKLTTTGRLAFDDPPGVALTSESELPLAFKVRPENGAEMPTGSAVVWIVPGPNLEVMPAARGAEHRKSLGYEADSPAVPISIGSPLIPEIGAKPSDRLTVDPSNVTAQGFFRGWRFERGAAVGIHPTPEVTMLGEVPAAFGSVTVRADPGVVKNFGRGSGALAIVFDASGSMKPAVGQNEKDAKIRQAKDALVAVLRKIPPGTAVRLWVYGEDFTTLPRELLAGDDPNQAAMNLFGIRKLYNGVWSSGDAAKLAPQIDAVVPYGFTPLVRTMRYAADDLRRLTSRPLKTMLVLTDGNDNPADLRINPNATAEEAEFRGGLSIPQYLVESFKDSNIRANVVFFALNPQLIGEADRAEQRNAETNLRVVETFQPKGTFFLEHDPQKVVRLLLSGADQKLTYRLERERRPVETLNGEPNLVSQSASEDAWQKPKLGAGVYTVRTRTERELAQDFAVDNGDRLILKLGEADLRRGLLSDDLLADDSPRKAESDGWRFSVLQNQWREGLHLLTALEKIPGGDAATIKQPKPYNAWFEITTPRGRPGAGALRWGPAYGFQAPCFSFDARTWPTDAAQVLEKPTVEAWWSSSPDLPAPAARLRRGEHFSDPFGEGTAGLSNRAVTVGEIPVTIESVTMRETDDLLIVRLRHPVGSPVILRLEGLNPVRQEHRYYQAAGKYTAIFSKMSRDGVSKSLDGISLLSVDQLKREAVARKDHVKLPLDSPPSANEGRPSEVRLD